MDLTDKQKALIEHAIASGRYRRAEDGKGEGRRVTTREEAAQLAS